MTQLLEKFVNSLNEGEREVLRSLLETSAAVHPDMVNLSFVNWHGEMYLDYDNSNVAITHPNRPLEVSLQNEFRGSNISYTKLKQLYAFKGCLKDEYGKEIPIQFLKQVMGVN